MSGTSEFAALLAVSTAASIAYLLAGIAGVLLISAVFYAVGRGEDRERERAAAQRREAEAAPDGETEAEDEANAARPRVPRSARERRRR